MDINFNDISPEVVNQVQKYIKLLDEGKSSEALPALIDLHNAGKVTLQQVSL